LSKLCEIFGNKDVVLVVFEIFLLHKDRVVYLPITKTAYQLTFTVVYRPNNVGAIEQIEDRYDKFRNMANVCPRILQENDDLKHEVNILHNQIEELEQYG
jgi:DNA repair ATPase RecN